MWANYCSWPDPPVTRLTWPAADRLPVVLYRIEGAGTAGRRAAVPVGPGRGPSPPPYRCHRNLAGHGDRQVMISCGTKKGAAGVVSDAPGRPLSGKGDNFRLEAMIMMASEPACNVDA